MKLTTTLLLLLAFGACKISIDDLRLDKPVPEQSKTMNSVKLSTQLVEGTYPREKRLVAPTLAQKVDTTSQWMDFRLWAKKSLARPFEPDLLLEVKTRGPGALGIYGARDSLGNEFAIRSLGGDTTSTTTETVHITLIPKAIKQNNNQDYLIQLLGKAPGRKARTYEIELPAYYHRGFMTRYLDY